MAGSAPQFGEGTVIEVNDGASSAYVAIDNVLNATPPDEAVVTVERNRLSVTDIVETGFSSRKDPGQLVFQYETDLTKFDRLNDLKNVEKGWRVTYAGYMRMAFTGRLINNAPDQIAGGAITSATATVRLTSLVTLSDATP